MESGKEERLTNDAEAESGAKFSPDCNRAGRYYLYAWSPDGEWLSASWLSDDGRTFEARAVRIEDGKVVTLEAETQAREASWLGA